MSRNAVILGAARTPVAPRGGALAALEIHDLGRVAVRAALDDAGVAAEDVDDLICANSLGAGGNPARLIALAAGLPERVAGLSIDRQCVGGLDAILLGQALIASGQANVVVAGGAESYSRRPFRARVPADGGEPVPYDQPPFAPWPGRDPDMHVAAAALADRLGVSRADQDAWAVRSHQMARAARAVLAGEIAPVCGLDHDPFSRELLPRVAARAPGVAGTVTAASAAVAADAAAFVVLAAGDCGIRVSGTTLGAAPEEPGLAPVPAIASALSEARLGPADLAASEIMEAYAVQAIACVRGAGLDPTIVNLWGGALARGHPIGASGAVLAVRAVHAVRDGSGPVLAAIAAAGGLGTAAIFQPA